jgi:ferric-dicitrate binding protein FerR (iron transport regulator)
MFEKHIIRQLTAYHHGELAADEKRGVELHLGECSKCRAAYEQVRLGVRLASALSLSNAPESIRFERHPMPRSTPRRVRRFLLAGALGSAALLIGFIVWNRVPAGPSWEVTGLPGMERLRPGQVLQTDSSSEAQIKIANVGELTVDPNTRIRLLVTGDDEHRIALERGRLQALTWSPPRLFIVETPLATAVDLGCKYTLEVEDDGSSLLHVTLGLVALERDNRETIVPAGAFCRTRPGRGPGTPFFEDSTSEFQSALAIVDTAAEGPERTRQLETVLRESRVRDALSLWHLIPRLDADSRGLIYDRLAQLMPPPPEVTRDGIIALDPNMLGAWKKIVSQLWQ